MKTNRKNLINQRTLIGKKLRPWLALRTDRAPRSGWIKAVRGALGMSARQLADRVGVQQSNITRLEEREAAGNITLERLAKTANAMNCKLIYAIVPNDRYSDLEAIIDEQARDLAQRLVHRTEHSMRLEQQGADADDVAKDVDRLTIELKSKMDSRIWGVGTGTKRPASRK